MNALRKEYPLWIIAEPVSQCSFKFQNAVIDGGGIKRE